MSHYHTFDDFFHRRCKSSSKNHCRSSRKYHSPIKKNRDMSSKNPRMESRNVEGSNHMNKYKDGDRARKGLSYEG